MNVYDQHQLGRLLHDARYRSGLTQEQAAAFLHVTRQAISNYERGKRSITPEHLHLLAELYGVPELADACSTD